MNLNPRTYCLALHPRGTEFSLQKLDGLQQYLVNVGLLGESFLMQGEHRYKLGERFYQLLSFMGCAPALTLEPEGPADEKFCHLRFVQSPQTVFRYLRPEVKARCPHCRKVGATAEEIGRGYFAAQKAWSCPHCEMIVPVHELIWKHEAGMGRFFLELIDVHPHEVVPTDSFLTGLAQATGHQWEYFYTEVQG